ncbi:hypothetical protein SAMN05421869_129117 [Nonomuraea jiangxiensis]|uniref:Uncharacterized protein n=1 Tax=Nonomuraea jiangxiensis TaxID=633440 RepID=A0A1G9MA47_9ACTN|nr:hypothetical protein SAMN05421869_129117 [Nonomuraea jiangxiensis]
MGWSMAFRLVRLPCGCMGGVAPPYGTMPAPAPQAPSPNTLRQCERLRPPTAARSNRRAVGAFTSLPVRLTCVDVRLTSPALRSKGRRTCRALRLIPAELRAPVHNVVASGDGPADRVALALSTPAEPRESRPCGRGPRWVDLYSASASTRSIASGPSIREMVSRRTLKSWLCTVRPASRAASTSASRQSRLPGRAGSGACCRYWCLLSTAARSSGNVIRPEPIAPRSRATSTTSCPVSASSRASELMASHAAVRAKCSTLSISPAAAPPPSPAATWYRWSGSERSSGRAAKDRLGAPPARATALGEPALPPPPSASLTTVVLHLEHGRRTQARSPPCGSAGSQMSAW